MRNLILDQHLDYCSPRILSIMESWQANWTQHPFFDVEAPLFMLLKSDCVGFSRCVIICRL